MSKLNHSLLAACSLFILASSLAAKEEKDTKPGINEATFKGLEWRGVGPALMSGRIADIAIDPVKRSTWFIAAGSGGVWKTTNRGTAWEPVFDDQGSYSIGCITIDPNQHSVIWVGTGENVGGRHVGYGDGVYKSLDGGETWKNMGLEKSEHIGMIAIDPRDSDVVYVAAQGPLWSAGGERGLFKTSDGGDSWTPISGDLSHGIDRIKQPVMGRAWSFDASWDLLAMSKFGTVTSLSESPLAAGLLYAGTDDGRIHVSEDGGRNWFTIERLPGVPDAFFVNDIKADLHDADTVYVVVDAHKSGDFSPYVLKSTNRGRSWTSLAKDLPERQIVWRIVQDHVNPKLLFLGTEFGVVFSIDGGHKWTRLAGGAPTIPFRDLVIQKRENDLVGATFGRGFWILDDYTPLRTVSAEQLQTEATLFPVRDALWYIPSLPLGDFEENGQSSQGDGFFVAPNPPFRAVFTYYLKDDLRSLQEQRREREKKREADGEDTPFPGWSAIRAEETEEAPAIVMTVIDGDGNIIRRLEGPTEAGFHRVAWDLRYPLSSPWTAEVSEEDFIEIPGPLAAPGTYHVSLAKRVNGQLTVLGTTQTFAVVQMREPGLKGASPEQLVAFTRKLDDLNRQVRGAVVALENLLVETGAIKQTLLRSSAPESLYEAAGNLHLELMEMQDRIKGNTARDLYGDPGPVSINQRINAAVLGTFRSSYGPTPTHVRSLEIALSEFSEVKTRLQEIHHTGLPALRRQLDEAGGPWTPGRGVPGRD